MSRRPGTQSTKRWAAPSSSGPMPESTSLATVACRMKAPLYISDRALPPESETVAIIQEWLRIPGTNGSTDDIHPQETDPFFTSDGSPQVPACKWKHVPGPVFAKSQQINPIIQGTIPNLWFLSALAAVSLKPNLIQDLFPELSNEQDSHTVTVQLYKYGYWQQVVVTTDLPCSIVDNRPLVATSASPGGELWVSLVEKAYAQLHGGYATLQAGCIGDVLVDLTGGVVTKVNLDRQVEQEPGQLWSQLDTWLQEGSVLLCMSRWKRQEPPDGLSVLPNVGYTVVASAVTNGTQMLQVSLPLILHKHEPFSQHHPHEGSTFWISYQEFLGSFNRLWAAQMFPSRWHQLTLHCGFHGPTAGGPHRLPSGTASSTWCCNPQFRVSVRKPCTLTFSLGQRDPQVVYQGHVKKAARQYQHGMTVVRVGPSNASRQWQMPGDEALVAETGLSPSREVVATVKADPGSSYVVIPFNSQATEEGPFILRMFSSTALEVEQLPSPFSLVLGGNWTPATAGGSWHHPSWGSNPQFMLTVQHQCQVVIVLCRSDLRYAIAKPFLEEAPTIGFALVRPEGTPQGIGRRTAVRKTSADLFHDATAPADEECVLLATLQPEQPYILVPYTSDPGVEAPFELRVISATPVELVPLPDAPTTTLQGQWTEETAGGCNLNSTWRRNPKFLLTVAHRTKCRVQLTSMRGWKRNKPLDDMIGFYILRAADDRGRVDGDWKSAVVVESPLVPMGDNSAEYEFYPDTYYVVMPCTYSPGKAGKFTITVSTSEPGVHFVPLAAAP